MGVRIVTDSSCDLAPDEAEVLGIDPFDIRVVTADTDLTPVDLGSYSSRVTLMTGNAAIQAAERARELLSAAVAEKLKVPSENLSFAERRVFDVENPEVGVTFAEAVVLAESKYGTIGTVGSYVPPRSPGSFTTERLPVFRSASKSFRGWGPETGGEGAGIYFRHREGAEPPETK